MNPFDDIRPYHDDEVRPVINRLVKDTEFLKAILRFRFPALPDVALRILSPLVGVFLSRRTKHIASVDGLQQEMEKYMEHMIKQTTAGLTVSGEEYLDKGKPHLFISNHRDIAMDPALLNWVLYHRHHKTLHVAIGDNLLTKPYVSDLMRLNKSFIVNRSATKPREKLKAAKHLSAYIHYALTEEQHSVWIAQKEGRAKDGIDRTNSAVIGMLALNKPKDMALSDYMQQLNIVPVSISYECDPCDLDKANELYSLQQHGHYQKDEHEDAASIAKGITGYKGRVHIAFGKPLANQGDYQETQDVVNALDRAIINHYVLHPSNVIAYQELHGDLPKSVPVTSQSLPFAESDFIAEKQRFHQRLLQCDQRYRDIFLSMYANPVVSQQSLSD